MSITFILSNTRTKVWQNPQSELQTGGFVDPPSSSFSDPPSSSFSCSSSSFCSTSSSSWVGLTDRLTQFCNGCARDSQVIRANLTLVAAAEAEGRIYLDLSHLICIRRRRTGWLSAEARRSGNIIHTILRETCLTNVLGRGGSDFYHFEFHRIFQSSPAQKMH